MAEKLPWSISTTVRNPERLRNFLKVLKKIEGEIWDNQTQCKFQILLIQERVYGFGNPQFYNASRQCKALTRDHIRLIESMDPITYDRAKEIFETKEYVDPAHRGRESINLLNKLGFAIARASSGRIQITELDDRFPTGDYDTSFSLLN
jgi:hypothetical protein